MKRQYQCWKKESFLNREISDNWFIALEIVFIVAIIIYLF